MCRCCTGVSDWTRPLDWFAPAGIPPCVRAFLVDRWVGCEGGGRALGGRALVWVWVLGRGANLCGVRYQCVGVCGGGGWAGRARGRGGMCGCPCWEGGSDLRMPIGLQAALQQQSCSLSGCGCVSCKDAQRRWGMAAVLGLGRGWSRGTGPLGGLWGAQMGRGQLSAFSS